MQWEVVTLLNYCMSNDFEAIPSIFKIDVTLAYTGTERIAVKLYLVLNLIHQVCHIVLGSHKSLTMMT